MFIAVRGKTASHCEEHKCGGEKVLECIGDKQMDVGVSITSYNCLGLSETKLYMHTKLQACDKPPEVTGGGLANVVFTHSSSSLCLL